MNEWNPSQLTYTRLFFSTFLTVAGYQFFPLRVAIPLRLRHSQFPLRVWTPAFALRFELRPGKPAALISAITGATLAAKSRLRSELRRASHLDRFVG